MTTPPVDATEALVTELREALHQALTDEYGMYIPPDYAAASRRISRHLATTVVAPRETNARVEALSDHRCHDQAERAYERVLRLREKVASQDKTLAGLIDLANMWEAEMESGSLTSAPWAVSELRDRLAEWVAARQASKHSCPYPAAGCTEPNCDISAGRIEQRAYERGYRDAAEKTAGELAAEARREALHEAANLFDPTSEAWESITALIADVSENEG